MQIRRFKAEDAAALAALIAHTLRTSNSGDYPPEYIENDIRFLTAEKLVERADWMHIYEAFDGRRLVGCGAIGPYWGKEDESSLFTIFVHPGFQGRGIGRRIIETLEQDEYFLRAKRIEVPASKTALGFYLKMGYAFKPGAPQPNADQLHPLEKRR